MRRVGIFANSLFMALTVVLPTSAQEVGPIYAVHLRTPCQLRPATTLPFGPGPEPSPRSITHLLNVQAETAIRRGLLATAPDQRHHHFMDAEIHARRAVRLNHHDLQARYWLAAALGLLTENAGLREQLRLGRASYEIAAGILAEDPDHAGAHHILGRFNAEVMRLGGMARFVAGRLLGSDLVRRASWDAAEEHLLHAARAEPHQPAHRLALARLYADTDRPDLAREQLDLVFQARHDPTAPAFHAQARALLFAIENE